MVQTSEYGDADSKRFQSLAQRPSHLLSLRTELGDRMLPRAPSGGPSALFQHSKELELKTSRTGPLRQQLRLHPNAAPFTFFFL